MTIQEILKTTDEVPVILAPMAGVTDLAFREICTEHGASFTYSEMISAKAVSYNNKKTFRLMDYSDRARPFGIQIFGHEPVVVGEIVKRLCELYDGIISLIDINMGCPAPKIVNNGDGCALMRDELLASKVIEYAVKASSVPVTVKFRKGWDDDHVNALHFAHMAAESGASAIAVHGRTRQQMYSGNADWDIIARIVAEMCIPVIGNGDVTDGESAKGLLSGTNCAGIMIGRGAQGNPYIFGEVKAALSGHDFARPTVSERIETALDHAKRHEAYKTPAAFPEMRKHLAWYTHGLPGASKLRTRIFACRCAREAEDILSELL